MKEEEAELEREKCLEEDSQAGLDAKSGEHRGVSPVCIGQKQGDDNGEKRDKGTEELIRREKAFFLSSLRSL